MPHEVTSYSDLDDEAFLHLARTVPKRPIWVSHHEYIEKIRALRDGNDPLDIPETHADLSTMRNHEGSGVLDQRILQLANWISMSKIRASVQPGGLSPTVSRGTDAQERFLVAGEKMLMRGKGLHNWAFEVDEDLAECGVSIVRSGPRSSYFDKMPTEDKARNDYVKGSSLKDAWSRERIDPIGFACIEDPTGEPLVITSESTRHVGEIAKEFGIEKAKQIANFHDFGTALSKDDPDAWPQHDTKLMLNVTVVEGLDNGALVVIDNQDEHSKGQAADRVITRWKNPLGRPSYFPTVISKRPWRSPLDRMAQLTNLRNFYATMLDLQAAGAAFRHWQLIEKDTQSQIPLANFGTEAPPEHIIYNMAEPPPNMGPGTEWILSPFEFHDLMPRYEAIRAQHEESGISVSQIMGQGVNQNTHVGTAHIMEHETRRNFNNVFIAKEQQLEDEWRVFFRWLRDVHKDQLYVWAVARDTQKDIGRFINIALSLSGEDVKSENITIEIRPDLPIDQAARYQLGMQMRANGDMTYRKAVEHNLVPFVDDAEGERMSRYVEERERVKLEIQLQVAAQEHMALISGGGAEQQAGPGTPPGRVGSPGDTGKGPDNIADSSMNPSSQDAIGGQPALISGG